MCSRAQKLEMVMQSFILTGPSWTCFWDLCMRRMIQKIFPSSWRWHARRHFFMYPGCSTDSKAAHQDGNAKVVARLVARAVEQDVRADIKWPSAAKNQTVCSKMSDFHASFMWAWGKHMQSRRKLHSRPHLKQTRTCKRQCTFKKKICYGSCQNSSHAWGSHVGCDLHKIWRSLQEDESHGLHSAGIAVGWHLRSWVWSQTLSKLKIFLRSRILGLRFGEQTLSKLGLL